METKINPDPDPDPNAAPSSKPEPVDINKRRRATEFLVPGRDGNGVSARIWCNVVPAINRMMDGILTTGRFPFRSKGDIMRWCMKIGLDRLAFMTPEVGDLSTEVNAVINLLQRELHRQEFATIFHSMTLMVDAHSNAGELDEARDLVREIYGLLSQITNERWRGKYLTEINSKFGHLMSGPGAGMGSFSEIDEEDGEGEGG